MSSKIKFQENYSPLLSISVCVHVIRENVCNTTPKREREAAVSFFCCPASRISFTAFDLLLWWVLKYLILTMLSKWSKLGHVCFEKVSFEGPERFLSLTDSRNTEDSYDFQFLFYTSVL